MLRKPAPDNAHAGLHTSRSPTALLQMLPLRRFSTSRSLRSSFGFPLSFTFSLGGSFATGGGLRRCAVELDMLRSSFVAAVRIRGTEERLFQAAVHSLVCQFVLTVHGVSMVMIGWIPSHRGLYHVHFQHVSQKSSSSLHAAWMTAWCVIIEFTRACRSVSSLKVHFASSCICC